MTSDTSDDVKDPPRPPSGSPTNRDRVHDWLQRHPTSPYQDSKVSRIQVTSLDSILDNQNNRNLMSSPNLLFRLTLLSALGGFLFGYDTGVVSGAMVLIKKEFNLSTMWHEVIVSITVAAAFLFALIGGVTSNILGRKIVIQIASVTFIIGSIVMAAAQVKGILLLGRMIVGIGIGLSSATVPVYIAEACPSEKRGQLVTLNNIFITGGQFIAGIICGAFSYRSDGWRFMLGIAALPAVFQFFGFFAMPESPRYLIKQGDINEAAAALTKIRNPNVDISSEMEDMILAIRKDESRNLQLSDIYKRKGIRKALIVGCLLQLFQQLAGINTVMYYSATIMEMAGFGNSSVAIWLACLTSFVNFSCTFIGFYFIDRIGRRPLLLRSFVGVILSLLVMSFSFYLIQTSSPASQNYSSISSITCDWASNCQECIGSPGCSFCLNITSGYCQNSENRGYCVLEEFTWYDAYCPSFWSFMPVIGLCSYLFFFAPGMGPLPWTINAEIYPNSCRSTLTGISTSVNWISNLLVSISFLSIVEGLGKSGTFLMYSLVSICGLFFFYYNLPETQNLSLEETETLFESNGLKQTTSKNSSGIISFDGNNTQYTRVPLSESSSED